MSPLLFIFGCQMLDGSEGSYGLLTKNIKSEKLSCLFDKILKSNLFRG